MRIDDRPEVMARFQIWLDLRLILIFSSADQTESIEKSGTDCRKPSCCAASTRKSAGDFVSIMGPSGAGKSTLSHPRHARQRVDRRVLAARRPIHQLSAKDRMRLQNSIGFVFQSYHLLDNLTVYENIDLPLSYRDVKKAEREGMVADILDRFNIVGKKDLFPNQLSGGQQQLVAIARAVVAKPTLILADEPTGNLHSDQGKEIMELFHASMRRAPRSCRSRTQGERVARQTRHQPEDGWIVDESNGAARWSPRPVRHRGSSSPTIRPTSSKRCGCC
jgi:ABC-type lipoprotein export system ATPase subunit